MFMTHRRFAARLQAQYQTSLEGTRREVTERYRFRDCFVEIEATPHRSCPDLGTSLSISDQVRESLDGLSRPTLYESVNGEPARASGQAIRVWMTSS
jgi:hypothetical protein